MSSLAHRKPTFGPASSADPQLREVVRAIDGGDIHPPPRRTWADPARGGGPRDSAYQSAVHSSTLPLKSWTPKMLAPKDESRLALRSASSSYWKAHSAG